MNSLGDKRIEMLSLTCRFIFQEGQQKNQNHAMFVSGLMAEKVTI